MERRQLLEWFARANLTEYATSALAAAYNALVETDVEPCPNCKGDVVHRVTHWNDDIGCWNCKSASPA